MRQLRAWLFRLQGLFTKAARERDFADELESHLQMHIDDNIRAGMSPRESGPQCYCHRDGGAWDWCN